MKSTIVLLVAMPIGLAFSSLVHVLDAASWSRLHSVLLVGGVCFLIPSVMGTWNERKNRVRFEGRGWVILSGCVWHAFLISRYWFEGKPVDTDVFIHVVCASTLSLVGCVILTS